MHNKNEEVCSDQPRRGKWMKERGRESQEKILWDRNECNGARKGGERERKRDGMNAGVKVFGGRQREDHYK